MVRLLNYKTKNEKQNIFFATTHTLLVRFRERHRDNRMWAEGPLMMTVWAGGGMRGMRGRRETPTRSEAAQLMIPSTKTQ